MRGSVRQGRGGRRQYALIVRGEGERGVIRSRGIIRGLKTYDRKYRRSLVAEGIITVHMCNVIQMHRNVKS